MAEHKFVRHEYFCGLKPRALETIKWTLTWQRLLRSESKNYTYVVIAPTESFLSSSAQPQASTAVCRPASSRLWRTLLFSEEPRATSSSPLDISSMFEVLNHRVKKRVSMLLVLVPISSHWRFLPLKKSCVCVAGIEVWRVRFPTCTNWRHILCSCDAIWALRFFFFILETLNIET